MNFRFKICFILVKRFVLFIQTVSEKLMAGFVECLDNEEAEEGLETEDGKSFLP